jgi:MFS family permease
MSAIRRLSSRALHELGFFHVVHASRDVHLLLLLRFLRMIAFGAGTLVLALYLATLGFTDASIGLFMTVLLLADAPRSLFFTIAADGLLGRRRTIFLAALAMTITGVVFANASQYWLLLLASILGIMPAGKEGGPFKAVEESTIAHLTDKQARTHIYAWYYVLVALGSAAGLFGAGFLVQKLEDGGTSNADAFRAVYWVFTGIGVGKMIIASLLSKNCELENDCLEHQAQAEHEEHSETEPLLGNSRPTEEGSIQSQEDGPDASESSRPSFMSRLSRLSRSSTVVLVKLCVLYIFDSIGIGMSSVTLINYWMDRTFGLPRGQLGLIMSVTQLGSAFTSLLSPSLARRIGLVPAMICTHLPAAITLALLPVARDVPWVIFLLVVRSCLISMQQAPRSTFLSTIVRSDDRTTVMGVLNVVKTLAQSVGPYITGFLAGQGYFWVAFVAAGSLRVGYDVGLFAMFVIPNRTFSQRAPHSEEVGSAESDTTSHGYQSEDGTIDEVEVARQN